MRVDLFDYHLPDHLIAQYPVEPRDHSRLLVYDRATGQATHTQFHQLGNYLRPGDALVTNNTRVLPARLFGRRADTEGKWEGLVVRPGDQQSPWEMMLKLGSRARPEMRLEVHDHQGKPAGLFVLDQQTTGGTWLARLEGMPDAMGFLESNGHMPLPPYIRGGLDQPQDEQRYQTVYAETPGAIAAPTAGLHFTDRLLEELTQQGIERHSVTLHVGIGTFQPIKVDDTDDHPMHQEWCSIDAATAEALNRVRANGGRIIAVGTTAVRTLESAAASAPDADQLVAYSGETRLFIVPPYRFRAVDAMVTNFHLPRSTLLMLVSAFIGREAMFELYRQAIEQEYRFYSYGDATLLI